MKTRFLTLALSVALFPGCGGGGDDDGSGDGSGSDGGGGGDDADAGPDADGFVPLLTTKWTLPIPEGPTPDEYRCATMTLDEDVIITAFRDISPSGTHHTVISAGAPDGADNPGFACDFFNNHGALLFASGVGTDDFVFPEGVGIRVAAGQQLFLNTHLFNASEHPISGTSGVSVLMAPAVETEAEFTLAGTIDINIPKDSPGTESVGSCDVQAGTILNWWPHMHQLGRHMLVQVNGDEVLDEEFTFTEQKNYPTNMSVGDGDTITVTCTHEGSPDGDVHFGDSSNEEMCFVGYYRYPKVGKDLCVGFQG